MVNNIIVNIIVTGSANIPHITVIIKFSVSLTPGSPMISDHIRVTNKLNMNHNSR